MKIALVSEFFYPTLGGVQEHLYNFALQLTRKGHTVRIVTPRIFTRDSFESWWPQALPREVYLPVGYSLPFFINGSRGRMCVGLGLGGKLTRLLTPENFDIVHLHAPLNGTLPLMANHFSTTATVGTFHTSFPGAKSLEWFREGARKQINKLDAVVGVSPISIDSISRYVGPLDSQIIPNGIDTEFFRPRWLADDGKVGVGRKLPQWDDDRLNILYVGRPDPRNGLDTLISAFARVVQKHPRLRLMIVGGGGEMERYRRMAAILPSDAVAFLGAIRDERGDVYRSADIHVFGVEKATHSITVMEGMASGLPLITSTFEGHETLGDPGRHFVTAPFGDVEALVAQLNALIESPARREELGRAARERAMEYSWDRVAEKILDVYRRVLAN